MNHKVAGSSGHLHRPLLAPPWTQVSTWKYLDRLPLVRWEFPPFCFHLSSTLRSLVPREKGGVFASGPCHETDLQIKYCNARPIPASSAVCLTCIPHISLNQRVDSCSCSLWSSEDGWMLFGVGFSAHYHRSSEHRMSPEQKYPPPPLKVFWGEIMNRQMY